MQLDPAADRQMARSAHRSTERGPRRRLVAALMRLADHRAQLRSHAEKPWNSITFSGARHVVELEFVGDADIEAGEAFIAALPDHEFTIPGQLVADAAIVEVDHAALPAPRLTVRAELLLLEEC